MYNLQDTDTKLALKADVNHTHLKENITDFVEGDYATAAQGALADSALQPGNNISLLTNDAGYITAASPQPGVLTEFEFTRDATPLGVGGTVFTSFLTLSSTGKTIGDQYKVVVSFIAQSPATNVGMEVTILNNATPIFTPDYWVEPGDTNERFYVTLEEVITLTTTNINLDIQFRSTNANTVTMHFAYLSIQKVN
jgi:hypothetical protein